MKYQHWYHKAVAGICMMLFFAGCATHRADKGKYDLMDNFTSRYNILYHSEVLLKEVSQQQRSAHQDAFEKVLPVFIEPPLAVSAQQKHILDSVAFKSQRLIETKPRSKHQVDAYINLGKSSYLKGDYHSASGYFDYVVQAFPAFRPQVQQALTWKSRANMHLSYDDQVQRDLEHLFAFQKWKKQELSQAFATQAQFYLRQRDTTSAILLLQQAAKTSLDRFYRVRWNFILGQWYALQQQNQEALRQFQKVMRSNTAIDLAFHAKLQQLALRKQQGFSLHEEERALRKMRKEDKYKDFRDAINLELGNVLLAQDRQEEAIEMLQLGIQEGQNPHYLTRIYLQLGEIFMQTGQYAKAKAAFQQAGMQVTAEDPLIHEVQKKAAYMGDITDALTLMAYKDSLMDFQALAPEQRALNIKKWAQEAHNAQLLRDKGKKKKDLQAQTIHDLEVPNSSVWEKSAAHSDPGFYFNNPDAMALGVAQFKQRWGQRSLQDNWRWNTGQFGNVSSLDMGFTSTDPTVIARDSHKTVEVWEHFYLQRFEQAISSPAFSPQAIKDEIQQAMIRIADTYLNFIDDEQRALEAYESLVQRFPSGEEYDRVLYQMVVLNGGVDQAATQPYKTQLLEQYPASIFTKWLQDPSLARRNDDSNEKFRKEYAKVFDVYIAEAYEEVIHYVESLHEEEFTVSQKAQLAYLRAMALGYTKPLTLFHQALDEIVALYPLDSLITPLVQQHLAYITHNPKDFEDREVAFAALDGRSWREDPVQSQWPDRPRHHGPMDNPEEVPLQQWSGVVSQADKHLDKQTDKQTDKQAYKITVDAQITGRDLALLPDSAQYYYVIHVFNPRLNLAPSRFGIGQFNRGTFPEANLSHHLKVVNAESQLISIQSFFTYEEVKAYEKAIKPLLSSILKMDADDYQTFITTEVNFGTLSDFEKINTYISRLEAQ